MDDKCPKCGSDLEVTFEKETSDRYWKVVVCSNLECGHHIDTSQVHPSEVPGDCC
jgi:hypothetical protein